MKTLPTCRHCGKTVVIVPVDDTYRYVTHGCFVKDRPLDLGQGCCLGIVPDGPYKGMKSYLNPPRTAIMTVGEEPT